jgi:hypothetical protein
MAKMKDAADLISLETFGLAASHDKCLVIAFKYSSVSVSSSEASSLAEASILQLILYKIEMIKNLNLAVLELIRARMWKQCIVLSRNTF